MSTIRQRISSQPFEDRFSQDDENIKKGGSDMKKDYQDRIVPAKNDDVNSYNQFYDILAEFEATLNEFGSKFGDLKQKLASRKNFPRSKLQNSDLQKKTTSHGKSNKLSEKEFTIAESPLTELFEIAHIKTLHNIFLVGLILILMSSTLSDSIETGTIHLGFATIITSFRDLPRAFLLWLCMKISTFVVFFGFRRWAARYQKNNKKTPLSKLQNLKYPIALIAYFVLFFFLPPRAVMYLNYSIPLNFALLMEQIRMMMKVYAFVRSSVPNVVSGKQPPDVSKFTYFMFAPTLVYRDNYPRKSTINWLSVIWNMIEVLFVIIYVAFLFERMLMPLYRNFGIEPLNMKNVYLQIFKAMLPSTLLFVFGFYLLLHSWMNAWAEALRFGDRTFYKDWWTVPSYHHFYRTWNTVVHDWLYTYVYKELYENYYKSKSASFVATIITSAIVHEYIIAFSLGFFYPVLFIFFGCVSIFFVFAGRGFSQKVGNVLFWLTLCSGNGLIVSLYLMEAYARLNCPPFTNDTFDVFVPRTWTTCY